MSTENKDRQEEQQATNQTATETQEQDNGLPKTQEELDALIEKRLARERKKMNSQQQGQTPPAQTATQTQTTQQTATPPAVDPALQATQQENLLWKAQMSAIKDGINPSVVEDAVYLALREAESKGEVDEDGIKDALKSVLKRHPEWGAKKENKDGGFKVGAGQNNGSGARKQKAVPTGTVIL